MSTPPKKYHLAPYRTGTYDLILTPLEEYKKFVDDLVHISPSVTARAIRQESWEKDPRTERQAREKELLEALSPGQREILAEMIQDAHVGGIHNTLAYLQDEINLRNLRIVRGDTAFANEPYGNEMYMDYVARLDSWTWPAQPWKAEYTAETDEKR